MNVECDDDYKRARQQVEDGLTASSLAADILKGLTKDKPSKGQGETEDDGSRTLEAARGRKNMEGVEEGKKAILSTGVERDEKMQHPRQRPSQEGPSSLPPGGRHPQLSLLAHNFLRSRQRPSSTTDFCLLRSGLLTN